MFFLLLTAPGNLFSAVGSRPLPEITVPGFGRSIRFGEIFVATALIKSVMFPVKQNFFYRKPVSIILIYAVFLFIMGLLIGVDIYKFLRSIRFIFPIFLLLSIPKLIPFHTVPKIFALFFTSTIILLLFQIFDLLVGIPVASIFGDTYRGEFVIFEEMQTIRSFYGPTIVLLSIVLSMAMLADDRDKFKEKYLYIISIFGALGVFLSATRGWMLAVVIIFAGFLLIQRKRTIRYIFYGIALSGLMLSIPQINYQMSKSIDRIQTLEELAKGDLTAGGTLGRITERSPRVMNKFWEQPVFGFGFSEEYYMFGDGHVGNQTLLLNGGFVGYAVYLYFIFFSLLKYYKAFQNGNKPAFIFLFSLLGIMVIHSSSRMIFAYSMDSVIALFLAMFFFFSDYYLKFSTRAASLSPKLTPSEASYRRDSSQIKDQPCTS